MKISFCLDEDARLLSADRRFRIGPGSSQGFSTNYLRRERSSALKLNNYN